MTQFNFFVTSFYVELGQPTPSPDVHFNGIFTSDCSNENLFVGVVVSLSINTVAMAFKEVNICRT